jgi:hypothetical protein
MTFAQRRNRLTTHFSERIPVVKRRVSVLLPNAEVKGRYSCTSIAPFVLATCVMTGKFHVICYDSCVISSLRSPLSTF